MDPKIAPQIEFTLQYRVKVDEGVIKYEPFEGRPQPEEKVSLRRWLKTSWEFNKLADKGRPRHKLGDYLLPKKPDDKYPPAGARYLIELLKSRTVPRSFEFTVPYVYVFDNAGREQCLAAYDVLTSGKRLVVAAFYTDKEDIAQEIQEEVLVPYTSVKERVNIELPKWIHCAGIVAHEAKFLRYTRESNAWQLDIHDTIRIYRYPLGEYAGVMLIPPFDDPFPAKGPEHAVLVARYDHNKRVRSTTICNAFLDVSRIVQVSRKRIVLLKGAPGAGKEVFARTIHFASASDDLSLDRAERPFNILGVAGISLDALRRLLFGWLGPEGHVVPGMIEQSKKGTLFLDEFDKASTDEERRDFYALLLRVLESGKYYPVGSLTPQEVGDVNWILAGAFTDNANVPRDLWSRLTDCLTLENPVREAGYAKALFLYWHFKETVAWYGDSDSFEAIMKEKGLQARVVKALLFGNPEYSPNEVYRPNQELLDFAGALETYVDGSDGTRAIRQASTAASRVLRDRLLDNSGKGVLKAAIAWNELFPPDACAEALGAACHILDMTRGAM